ncbi:hypothetical protein GYMLUDRAFT_259913 [Collybiopsis luxurians FD-317 M1]|uniref:NmrA-like domain-containing protein n=1 Tax=Collybiopsis luxurians FD-317 M1 TaxID=944289 RepID=A0A0D0D1V0_9AGAR|nr:hypothetical protein GYMLUDRAFT_259913 [Collybiopsis luxurians FD-317 M1]
MTRILMTGVTGYIGGAVLTRFAQRPDFNSFDIRAVVRSAEKGEKIQALYKNVTPIVGSHSDISLMSKAAAEVGVVIAMADSDSIEAATGTLQGLKKEFERTGRKPIFINTSGTGVLSDNAVGMYASETIWDDADSDQMASLKPTQRHRPVDLKIVAADEEVADLYSIVFDAVQSPKGPGHGREGYYFGANQEHTLYEVGQGISDIMHKRNTGNGGEPTTFTKEEVGKRPRSAILMGSNSRCRPTRSRALGWAPKLTTKDMIASLYAETELVLELAKLDKP